MATPRMVQARRERRKTGAEVPRRQPRVWFLTNQPAVEPTAKAPRDEGARYGLIEASCEYRYASPQSRRRGAGVQPARPS